MIWSDRVDEFYRTCRSLFARRKDERWYGFVRHVMPELIPAADLTEMEDDGLPQRICGRARTDVLKLASAHINYITPRGQSWFQLKPPGGDDVSDDEKEWYSFATRRVRLALEKSNFYSAQIAAVVDRCATGTGAMLCEETDNGLVFTHIPAGTYAIAENEFHRIDTLARKFNWTAHQAAMKWGEDALSPAMRNALKNENTRYSQAFEIWHLTVPNPVPDAGMKGVPELDRNYLSVYLDPREKTVLEISGYYEFPYLVSRFLKYGNAVYGTGPLAGCQAAIADSLNMNEALKVAAQRMAIPSILASASLVGEMDLRGGGITVMRPEDWATPPQAWAPAGQYQVGKDLLELYYNDIDEATFVSVLQAVTQVERTMTATEVTARETERMMTFSQSFTQFANDFEPLMNRVYACCFRAELLPKNPPFEVLEQTLTGGIKLKAPAVSYVGLLAKALRRAEYSGLMNTIQIAMQFSQATGSTEAMDFIKLGEAMRFVADEEMAPEACLRKNAEIKAMREERQALEQQQAAMQMMMQQAAANKDNAQAQNLQEQTA